MRYELKHCRWCGHVARFQVQLVIGGAAELVTDQLCRAPSVPRILCEPARIEIGTRTKFSRTARRRR